MPFTGASSANHSFNSSSVGKRLMNAPHEISGVLPSNRVSLWNIGIGITLMSASMYAFAVLYLGFVGVGLGGNPSAVKLKIDIIASSLPYQANGAGVLPHADYYI
jgi:hypothetical protein